MNAINIHGIHKHGNRLNYDYSIHGGWKKYFHPNKKLFIEYSVNILAVPFSVAIIPLLCNILPMAWIFDAEIILDELDQDFYECLEKLKQGYAKMYPKMSFKGRLNVKKLIKHRGFGSKNTAVLFSGGIDSYHTLFSHMDEKPALVTVWGSDISLADEKGWNLARSHTEKTAAENGMDCVFIKSSFRQIILEEELTAAVSKSSGDNWWHGFQHGIGLLGHMAPYAFQSRLRKVYIASSLSMYDKGVTCASYPTIDNELRFNGCWVYHDSFEYRRQEKIHRICSYVDKTGVHVQFRVCWRSTGGTNCCRCEKCIRTILGIIAVRGEPRRFGFNYSDSEFPAMMRYFRKRVPGMPLFNVRYQPIQDSLRSNYTASIIPKSLKWFYRCDLERLSRMNSIILTKMLGRGKSFVRQAFEKRKKVC